jgi:multiple sugar transport system substrate-binding protein
VLKKLQAVALATAGFSVLAACSSGGGNSSAGQKINTSEDIKGQTITVLMPPWADLPQSLLDDFTKQTGVKVKYTVAQWDAIRDKISVAGAAQSQLADVVEFDWSWTGMYGQAGWFVPLEKNLDTSDMSNNEAFSINGHMYGACYNNDFRSFQYNQKMFQQAGISSPPKTFDEVVQDAKILKAKGVSKYPLAFPLQSEETTSMTWYLMVLAMGGQLFDDKGAPAFEDPSSPGYKALQFYMDGLKNGLINPADTSMSDTQEGDAWRAGGAAITYAAPGDFVSNDDPSMSKVVGQVKPMLVPGTDGPGASYGLPEGLGVMSTSEHKAAALAFINWWEQPSTLQKIYDKIGLLPCRKPVFESLVKDGKLNGGDVLLKQQDYVKPLFPNGAPPWYGKFSTNVSSLINAAAKGDMSVDEAIHQMADTARQLTQ